MVAEALERPVAEPGAPASERSRPAERPELGAVYEEHFRYVWRCLRSLGVHDAQLDDALQDVFMVVQRRLGEFDGNAALRTWLYAIALRIARKYRDSARRAPGALDAAPRSEPCLEASAEGHALHHERLTLARAALASLSDEQREVFVLARVEQMSAPEMAGILGIPINTVYSRLRAARLAFEAEVARRKNSSTRSTP